MQIFKSKHNGLDFCQIYATKDELQNEEIQEMKYHYTVLPEYTKKEMLFMEKEMLGLYISGHPLESMREQIEKKTNVNTLLLRQLGQNTTQDEQELVERIYNTLWELYYATQKTL